MYVYTNSMCPNVCCFSILNLPVVILTYTTYDNAKYHKVMINEHLMVL